MRSLRIGLAAALLVVAATCLVVRRAAPRGDPAVRVLADHAPAPNEDGLVVDVTLVGPEDQARSLRAGSPETSWGFTRHPSLLTARVLANPLFADDLKATIRNASGGLLTLANARGGARDAFRIETRLEDAAGRPVGFRGLGESGLKWLGTSLPGDPTATIEPGGSVEQRASIWTGLNPASLPAPGSYTARLVITYVRTADGGVGRIESPPIAVAVTAEDVADHRALAMPLRSDAPGFLDLCIHLLGW
ncbi:hypothetical protein [Paludisphaera soli]|uniref:hypothetical protein n=1 Tax=Paludisphaera soli TaxID=2712865 RepID=UPI0013ED296D|nr:hypothetical protein [Paludisphaera soli]